MDTSFAWVVRQRLNCEFPYLTSELMLYSCEVVVGVDNRPEIPAIISCLATGPSRSRNTRSRTARKNDMVKHRTS